MSDTPRTDAIVVNGDTARFLKMSRMLERELVAMTEQRDGNLKFFDDSLAMMRKERDALLQELSAKEQECAELRKALEEVVKVLNSNNPAITDTVWVSDGRPETLLDCCLSALGREEP